MYGYLLAAGLFALDHLVLAQLGRISDHTSSKIRVSSINAACSLLPAFSPLYYLQKYSAYHAIEFILLAVWLGSTKVAESARLFSLGINLVIGRSFSLSASCTCHRNFELFWITLVSIVLVAGRRVTCRDTWVIVMEREPAICYILQSRSKSKHDQSTGDYGPLP